MYLIGSIIAVGFLLALVFHCWWEVSGEMEDYSRQWFTGWVLRGMMAPIGIWLLLNLGTMPFMPPLTAGIANLRAAGKYALALGDQTALALVIISSCWAALTLGWFMTGVYKRARNIDDLLATAVFFSPLVVIIYLISAYTLGWTGIGVATVIWLWPLTIYSADQAKFGQPPPTYSRAMGKIKFGKYREAEMAIISELEKCETNFDGWMMLAELYANQFHDLAEAEKTICDLCDEPSTTLPQVSLALHRLADWQLQLRGDPVAAARVLEEICKRMPGTHLALMARNRINQLPHSLAEINERQHPRTVQLQHNIKELAGEKSVAKMGAEAARASADEMVKILNDDPNDAEAREKLAKIFAEQMEKIDLAVEQLELLMAMPGQPAAKMLEWMELVAAWQMKSGVESETVMMSLERLIHEFPQSKQAFEAQRRLSIMLADGRLRRYALKKETESARQTA